MRFGLGACHCAAETETMMRSFMNNQGFCGTFEFDTLFFKAIFKSRFLKLLFHGNPFWKQRSKQRILLKTSKLLLCVCASSATRDHTISLKNDFYNPHCRLKFFFTLQYKNGKKFQETVCIVRINFQGDTVKG